MMTTVGKVRVGISGWRYPPWRKVFYPAELPQRQELEFVASKLSTIEINGSFYSLQRPESYAQWAGSTPEDFVFAVKGPQFITHIMKLNDVEVPLSNFFASGILRLGKKLGPLLWQFPPQLAYDPVRFERFFKMLPRTGYQAVQVAKRHDSRLKGRAWLKAAGIKDVRHAVEIRHESFRCSEFVELLRTYNIALVVADTAGKWPLMEDVTADFMYMRLHGDIELYASGYTDAALDRWKQRVKTWCAGRQPRDAAVTAKRSQDEHPRDVFVYFDNDVKVRAPFDALGLANRVGVEWNPPALQLRSERTG